MVSRVKSVVCGGGWTKERIMVFEKPRLADERSIGARMADGFSFTPKAVGDPRIRGVHSRS